MYKTQLMNRIVAGIGLFALVALCIPFGAWAQSALNVDYTVINPTDDDLYGGSITLAISGGVSPYSVTWCDSSYNDSLLVKNLTAGYYNCKVKDAADNEALLSVQLYFVAKWNPEKPYLSLNRLDAESNGWMEFDVTDSLLDMRVGFVFDDFDADSILDVGFDMQDGELKVFMNDSVFLLPSEVNIVANASYKIERIGSYFAFYRNGFKIFGRTGTQNAALGSPPMHGGWQDRTALSFTLIPASVLSSRFSFNTDYNSFYYPYKKCSDDFNWVYTEIYNGYGVPVSATKQFIDHLGRPVQSQEMNVTENRILAAEVKYDALGRPVLSTLPAPINNIQFCYKQNFMPVNTDNGLVSYQFEHFDEYGNNNNINTPLPVASAGYGDLGWYYSNSNTIEPFVAATTYPYKRAEFFPYPGGEAKRASAEGNVLRMGSGHEKRVFTMPEASELEWVFGKGISYENNINNTDNFNPTLVVAANGKGIAAYKSIAVDENGTEQISYSNGSGQTIASCLVGQDVCASGIQNARLRMTPGYGAAIHVPAALFNSSYEMKLTVKSALDVGAIDPANLKIDIIDLNTYETLAATDFEIDATSQVPVHSYMVLDKPVDASTCPVPFACGPYFWLTKNIKLKFTSTYLATHTGSGYYRILINHGYGANWLVDYIEIEHPLNYSNWTINYYDAVTGQLTKSIPPLGIDCEYNPDLAVTITDRDDHIIDVYDATTPEYLVPSNDNYHETISPPTALHTQSKIVSMHLAPNNADYNFLNANDENVPVGEEIADGRWCHFLENEEDKSAPYIICYTDNVFVPPVINVGASNADPLKDPPTPVEFTPVVRMPIDDGLFLKREVLGPGSHVLDVEHQLILPSSEMPLRDLEAMVTDQIDGASEHRNLLFTNTGSGQANFIAVPNPDFTSIIQGGWGNSDFCTYGQYPCVIGDVLHHDYTNVYTELQSWAQVYHFLHCCNSLHELTTIYNSCVDPDDIINANPWSEGESPYNRLEHLATFYLDVDVIAENTSNSSISRVIKPAKLQLSVAKACCLLIWYNCKLTGVEFSDQELSDKNNLRIRVTKVKVGTGSDPNEYLNPTYQVDGAPISPMPPHLIMDFDADWRYHSLLQFTNIKLAVTTLQDPIIEPAHTMAINYLYDGYGQMVATKSPDEGIKEVKYDSEGKPRFTQDAEQKLADKFSYVNYDNEDRVIETGEYDYSVSGSTPASSYYFNTNLVVAGVTNTPPSYYIDLDDHLNDKLVGSYAPHFKDVSTLAYDMPVSLPTGLTGYTQRYMGGRVARTSGYSNTYYSYDYNGNPIWTVKSLPIGNKTIDYEYDILGMARKVSYQKNVEWEQFHHHYSYDRSLRLSKVFTSFDGNLSNASLQVRYIYYLHGPVKRVELGNKLQGIDYVYTINGWLKSINNPDMVNQLDPGGDGAWYGEPGTTPVADPEGFAFDVFAENLDYFPGDYTRYGTYVQTFNKTDGYDPFASTTYNNGCSTAGTGGLEWGCPTPNLTTIPARYNGLIQSATWRTLADNDEINPGLHNLSTYTTDPGMRMQLFDYDNQYRLKSAVYGKIAQRGTQNYASHITPHSPAFEPEKDYLVYNLTYNKNGNILTHKRNGNNALYPERDNLTYNYNAGTNQLNYVQDAAPTIGVPSNLYGFLNQSSNNYGYDAIGRIVSDAGASNTTISYHHNQKVEEVKESGNLKMKLYYDEAGNRVKKETYDATGTTLTKITHYVPDGGGSIMAIYEENDPGTSQDLEVEYPVYAGDKTGTWYAHLDWQSAGVYTRTIVKNEFELKDHLGNIRAVIESTKDSKGHPLLVSHNDYYPFGSVMPGPASLNPPGNGSRYGYQGKELLSETGLYDFGLRMYNSDLGKWLSPDPYAQYWSPYTAMGNNPVSIIDPTGGYGYVDMDGDHVNDGDAINYYIDGMKVSEWEGRMAMRGGAAKLDYGGKFAFGFEIKQLTLTQKSSETLIKWRRGISGRTEPMPVTITTSSESNTYYASTNNFFVSQRKTEGNHLWDMAWYPLDKAMLLNIVHTYTNGSGGTLQNTAGSIFENAFHNWMYVAYPEYNYEPNVDPYPTTAPGRQAVVPDGIADQKMFVSVEGVPIEATDPNGYWFDATTWFEVKASDNTITPSSYNNQPMGEIMALYNHKRQVINQMSKILISKTGGTLTFVTTHEGNVSNKLVKLGKVHKVTVNQLVSYYRYYNGQYQVTFAPKSKPTLIQFLDILSPATPLFR